MEKENKYWGREEALPQEMDSIGFWNTRGLNRLAKQKEVKLFLHQCKVSLFGLLETKIKMNNAQKVALNLCNGWFLTNNLGAHPGGRIWIVWKPAIMQVQIEFVSAQVIHCAVMYSGNGAKFYVTFVYGFNDPTIKRPLWQEVRDIKSSINGPWALMGDFNCVLNKEDRIGRQVTMAEIREFRECIAECGL